MNSLKNEVNRVWNIAVYLQMIAAFSDDLNFDKYSKLMFEFHKTIKEESDENLKNKLKIYENKLDSILNSLKSKYPPKRTIPEISKDWNDKFKIDKDIFSNGVMIGWLEEQIDLKHYKKYDYYPYHFKIGLVVHKNRGEIEEHFLLKDSFLCLVKAQNILKSLETFGQIQKEKFKKIGKTHFDDDTLNLLNALKYEASFYSRMAIVSFFAFLECIVNSIGFDYFYRNQGNLNSDEVEILMGSKNNRYLSLKGKIEKFQIIIRSDKKAKIFLLDEIQIKEPFKTLFKDYEDLRNASVHFSPLKSRIWLKPHDWTDKAEKFSKLVIQAALEIWKSIHETNKGPDYLGRLEYPRLYETAKHQENEVRQINNYLSNRLIE